MIDIFTQALITSTETSFLIVAVIIVRAIFKNLPKVFRKILWGLAIIRLFLPYSIKSSLSLIPKKVGNAAPVIENNFSSQTVRTDENLIFTILSYVWIIVTVALISYGIVSFVKLKIKLVGAVCDKENIFFTEKIDSPFVCGFFKPKIYIPFNIPEETREYVLSHERLHIKNADHILKVLGFLLVCIYWFNPLVWVSYFLFCKDIELACDEGVIKDYSEENRKKYASAILDVGVNKVKLSVCPVAFGEVAIKERVMNAVNYKKITKLAVLLSVVLCFAVAVFFMTDPKTEPVKEKNEPNKVQIVPETTTEPTIEPVTEQITEPITEQVTEPVTEANESYYEDPEPPTLSEEERLKLDEAREKALNEHIELLQSQWESSVAETNRRKKLSGNATTNSYSPYTTLPIFCWDPQLDLKP